MSEDEISNDSDVNDAGLGNGSQVSKTDSGGHKAQTRSKIATLYVRGFFLTIGAVFVLSLWRIFTDSDFFSSTEDLMDLLITVSGILSGPLGFIIGYYFKTSQGDD